MLYWLNDDSIELGTTANCQLVSKLVNADAFPDGDGSVHITKGDGLYGAFTILIEAGLVKDIGTDINGGDDDGGGLRIRLTPEGVAALRYGQALHEPRGVFEPRPNVAVQGKTVLECICELKDRGFEWRLLPDSLAARAALPAYQLGGAKVWYSTRRRVDLR